ncbi:MAG TPA: hypothetical protein VMH87_16145 [Pseudomonadales bacterium]|nr:hypothetical protein [Pseudomonadales bacterium]
MIPSPKTTRPPDPIPRPYRRAAQRMDEALQKNSRRDNREKIEIFGRMHFGDLWVPRDPSTI